MSSGGRPEKEHLVEADSCTLGIVKREHLLGLAALNEVNDDFPAHHLLESQRTAHFDSNESGEDTGRI